MCMYAHTVIRLTFWENYTVEVHANITFYPVCTVFTRNIPKQVMEEKGMGWHIALVYL